MKKFTVIGLCVFMAVSLAACGKNVENNDKNNTTVTETNVQDKNNTKKEEASQTMVNLTKVYRVPVNKKIYVNVPDYQEIESGFTKLYVIGRQINIAITADDTIKETALEQAHESIFKVYAENMHAEAVIDELKVEKDSKVTVNGTEMYKFEGKLACHAETGNYELYTIGYSFVMDGIPCSIEGTVLDKSQPEDMINQVIDTVNAMAQTVRNTK
jgi:hypothetical protein